MKSKHNTKMAIIAVALVAALSACTSAPKAAGPYEFDAKTVAVASRGIAVVATLTVPRVSGKVPLVVMAHGHGGSKEEAGGFTAIAEELAKGGIATIRMDFPGCGASAEPFTANDLTNMLADIEASRLFSIGNAPIDEKRIGMFGYSMGGRLAILSTARAGYKSLGLLAPVSTDGSSGMYVFMGGEQGYTALSKKAATDGHVIFTTPFGQVQDLSAKWFSDNESAKCIAPLAAYAGPILFVHGDVDTIITQAVIDESVAAAKNSSGVKLVAIAGADHGYGFYGGDPRIKTDTVSAISGFFAKTLR